MSLSQEVARIMWPDRNSTNHVRMNMTFNHTTPEAGFQMAIWLAKKWDSEGHEDAMETMGYMLARNPKPNERLAEVIKATQEGV